MQLHAKLIIVTFKKGKEELIENGNGNPSVSAIADLISTKIFEISNEPFGGRTLRDLYKSAINNEVPTINQAFVSNALSKYLGYDNFKEFSESHKNEDKKIEKITIIKRKPIIIGVSLFVLILVVAYANNSSKCMVWNDNKYVKIKCSESETEQVQIFDPAIFSKLKKVKPSCDYPFFNPDGSENLWYQKGVSGKYEFFTYTGRHPETGKTLKKITEYMIDKYICEGYKN